MGVIRASPADYVAQYGASLIQSASLPAFVREFSTPAGLVLAAESSFSGFYELEGDVAALKLIDLNANGLSEYASYIMRF